MSTETTRGPWVRDGKAWKVTFVLPGKLPHVYIVEQRRWEPGAPAGYWLFGPEFGTGFQLSASDAEMARYEAFARIAERCTLPGPAFDYVVTRSTGR